MGSIMLFMDENGVASGIYIGLGRGFLFLQGQAGCLPL
jgi:hypothetical protein